MMELQLEVDALRQEVTRLGEVNERYAAGLEAISKCRRCKRWARHVLALPSEVAASEETLGRFP